MPMSWRQCGTTKTAGTFLGHALPGFFMIAFGCALLGLLGHRLRGAGAASLRGALDTTERNLPLVRLLGLLVASATTIGLVVEAIGSAAVGCGFFSAHVRLFELLYAAFCVPGVAALCESRSLLPLGAHRYALSLALLLESVLYMWHSGHFAASRHAMYASLAALAFVASAASLLAARRPALVLAYGGALATLVAQGCWFFYLALHIHDPLEPPLAPRHHSDLQPGVSSGHVALVACALLGSVNAAAGGFLAASCRRSVEGSHAYLASAGPAFDAEMGQGAKGQ
eukprot:CAMPEP_0119361722 /NCGR_PEP_ID=MMETSP1334-20130426/8972_1 /TAXON_ID=127549 /ORGANISM="Calcidiscus leptoporus, Strain RCC1130" /LENGTH=283 /DNA_ID=CAMNT_0007376813 /DNA_START=17 /DNA_END=868 /DNA_ORIENTATION=-